MLMGNDCRDCNKYNRMEMKNVNKDILAWLEDIIEENNSRIERKEWNTMANGKGGHYMPNQHKTMWEDMTLYAIWSR